MSAGLVLPKIQHPQSRLSDPTGVAIRGSNLRPKSISDCVSLKPNSKGSRERALNIALHDVFEKISSKLKGPNYYILRQSFKSFDPQGQGNVTKQALFRLLYNQGLISNNLYFQELLQRFKLDKKDVISFSDFYSKFHERSQSCPHWMDPVTRHGQRTMTANQVLVYLREKAKERMMLSELFPFPRGPPQSVTKPEFINMLRNLGLNMSTEELDKLWKRFDPCGEGTLSVEMLLRRLGISFSSNTRQRSHTWPNKFIPTSPEQPHLPNIQPHPTADTLQKAFKQQTDFERHMLKYIHGNWAVIAQSLKELDTNNTGKVNVSEMKKILHIFGIRATVEQLNSLIQRTGQSCQGNLVKYNEFLKVFMDRSHGSIADSILRHPNEKPPLQPGRACTSVNDIEIRLVNLLQNKFLKLVSAFKIRDPKGSGLLRRSAFLASIEEVTGMKVDNPDEIIASVGEHEPGWIAYPCFLSKFQEPSTTCENGGDDFGQASQCKAEYPNQPKAVSGIRLTELIQKVVRMDSQNVFQILEDLDDKNTGRIKCEGFQLLLDKLGIGTTREEYLAVWNTLIKDKWNSVDHHEFIRHFMGFQSVPILPSGRHWSEDHCFQRSLKLHRDEDMIMEKLKSNVKFYFSSVAKHFMKGDENKSGFVAKDTFTTMIKELCPELTETEMNRICVKFNKSDDPEKINYNKFLYPLRPSQQLHRTGYNMSLLLSHHPGNTNVSSYQLDLGPQKGIPGAAAMLRQMIGKKWRNLQRLLRAADPERCNFVPTKVFLAALKSCEISLTKVQELDIQEVLDPTVQEKINYAEFLKAFLNN